MPLSGRALGNRGTYASEPLVPAAGTFKSVVPTPAGDEMELPVRPERFGRGPSWLARPVGAVSNREQDVAPHVRK